jgi:MFS family permease
MPISYFQVVSMYLAEIADKNLRGTLTAGTSFMFNFGILMTIAVGPFLSYQVLNISLLVLPIIYFVACWWIPESPYYYLKKGKVEQATRIITKLRNHNDKKVRRE